MKLIVFATIFLILCTRCMEQEKSTNSLILAQYFQDSALPSAIMGHSTKDGKTEWHAYGPSIWNTSDTVTRDHIFRIASMTKAITSVAALQLVERGLVSLDEPLYELMPEMDTIPILTETGQLTKSKESITLRHLLTHTSGFGYSFTSPRLASFEATDWHYEDSPRLFEPGESWHYGTSIDWVGRVVEKVSGDDLETYIRKNITGPLKMTRTFFNVPDSLKSEIVSWGVRDSTGFKETQRIPDGPVTSYSGGGGLYSSPADYLTFLICLLNDGTYDNRKILMAETVEMLFQNHLPEGQNIVFDIPEGKFVSLAGGFPDESDKHGLSWAIEDSKDEVVRSKGAGYWAGIGNSYYTIDKKKGVAVVYFTQFLPFNDKVSFDFYRFYEKQVYSQLD